MSAHTPGPWALRKEWDYCEDALEVFPSEQKCQPPFSPAAICLVSDSREDECIANARLIAAAPDLLAALKSAESALASYASTHVGVHHSALDACRAAIAKAEGRAQ